ncbi:MAG: glycosyltransferase [Pelagibacteraceae bacterium]
MKNNAIVTLADEKYFELLIELIDSIKSFKQSENVSICVLDAGLRDEQIEILKTKVHLIKKANWDIEVPSYKTLGKEWLKSQVSRAFLPEYFPDFEKYLWIDCDAWVNNWECIDLFFKACNDGKLGIVQSIGPGYRIMANVKWLFSKIAIINSQNYKHAKSSGINEKDARKIAFAPHLNIGVFSLEKNSNCWKVWQKNLKKTLSKGRIFGSEGLAINISVYIDKVPTEFLPLYCNWIASNLLPKYNEKINTFVEPNLPHNNIGILHLAAGIWVDEKDMRTNKNLKIDIKTIENKNILKSLRYNS